VGGCVFRIILSSGSLEEILDCGNKITLVCGLNEAIMLVFRCVICAIVLDTIICL
jgi:hypothetical protein